MKGLELKILKYPAGPAKLYSVHV